MNCDTLQICKHGVPAKFNCPQCLVKPLSCDEHYLRQLDETRKISRRVDELEQLLNDFIKSSNGRHERLLNKIGEIEESLKTKFVNPVPIPLDNYQKKPFICPVCQGKGYWHLSENNIATGGKCGACNGDGAIWG